MATTTTDHNGLLRFTTAGSVDDGKSTLIGRLLYDSKAFSRTNSKRLNRLPAKGHRRHRPQPPDGRLKAEREQGITIDVAYRYFATPKRKFIMRTRRATFSTPGTW